MVRGHAQTCSPCKSQLSVYKLRNRGRQRPHRKLTEKKRRLAMLRYCVSQQNMGVSVCRGPQEAWVSPFVTRKKRCNKKTHTHTHQKKSHPYAVMGQVESRVRPPELSIRLIGPGCQLLLHQPALIRCPPQESRKEAAQKKSAWNRQLLPFSIHFTPKPAEKRSNLALYDQQGRIKP